MYIVEIELLRSDSSCFQSLEMLILLRFLELIDRRNLSNHDMIRNIPIIMYIVEIDLMRFYLVRLLILRNIQSLTFLRFENPTNPTSEARIQ